jgi:hypothetical protein
MAARTQDTLSDVRIGTILRAILGSAVIAGLGVLWVLQSREHQRLQDQITLSKSNCTVLVNLIREDGRELDPLTTRPALMQKIQEFHLGLTNIAYRQVVRVTNSAVETDTTVAKSRPSAPAPALATAAPR